MTRATRKACQAIALTLAAFAETYRQLHLK